MDPLISTPDLGIDTGLVTNDRSFAQLLGANLAISDGEIGTFSTPVPSPEDEYPREAAGQGQSRAEATRCGRRGPAGTCNRKAAMPRAPAFALNGRRQGG